jgi:hypothetical protein
MYSKNILDPLKPSKLLKVQTGKSELIFAYYKVSQRNLARKPHTFNYMRAVSLVL